jgi:hypothetical protein
VKFVGGKVKKGEKDASLSPSIGHQTLKPSINDQAMEPFKGHQTLEPSIAHQVGVFFHLLPSLSL